MAIIISFEDYYRLQRVRRTPASTPIKPSNLPERQGSLDGLCGIYCIVNAVGHVAKLSSEQRQSLFKRLIKALDEDRRMTSCLLHGTPDKQLLRLFKVAGKWLKDKHNTILVIVPMSESKELISLKQYVQNLSNFLYDDEGIFIAGIEGIHHHWTCISSVTAKTIQLMDSDGLSRLRLASCRISKKAMPRYHCLHPRKTWGIRCYKP